MPNGRHPLDTIATLWFAGVGLLVAGAALAAVSDEPAAVVLGLLIMCVGMLVAFVGAVATAVRLGLAARATDEQVATMAAPRPRSEQAQP